MRRKLIVLVIAILFVELISLRYSVLAAEDNTNWVSFIDIGQGDSILVWLLCAYDPPFYSFILLQSVQESMMYYTRSVRSECCRNLTFAHW